MKRSHEVTNLPPDVPALPAMPLAPGNAKAAEPVPAHVTAQGTIPYVDKARDKSTRERVAELTNAPANRRTFAEEVAFWANALARR